LPIHMLLSLSALLLPKGAVWTDVSGRGSATVAFATKRYMSNQSD